MSKFQKNNKENSIKNHKEDSKANDDPKNVKLQETNHKLQETVKMMEQKLLFLQEENEQKDTHSREMEQSLNTLKRQSLASNPMASVDKSKKDAKVKDKKVKGGKAKPTASSSKLVKEEEIDTEQVEKLKKDLEIAQRNEQLITKSLKKKETDAKTLEEKLETIRKKLDFQSRELETTKASLDLAKKQSARADKNEKNTVVKSTNEDIKTKTGSCQTENNQKSANTQCTIPSEIICISDIENGRNSSLPSLNLTNIVHILQLKAGIKDVSSLIKYFKKTNEKEIKSLQASLSGGAPNHEVPEADLSQLGDDVGGAGELAVDSEALRDVEIKARDAAVSFVQTSDAISKRLNESVQYRAFTNLCRK